MQDNDDLTTAAGIPVADNQNSLTAGPRGPVMMQDFHLIEKMAHFNRERIPERVVHAKGAGAFGIFTVTGDITRYTRARVFSEIGKKTEVLVRFSTVGGEKGSADSARDPRGFAVKFYTEEGNWDLVGNNTPVFFVRDPLKFSDFIHTQKRDPQTNLKSPTMMWDFWSLSPESLHQVTILFSDRGTPKNYSILRLNRAFETLRGKSQSGSLVKTRIMPLRIYFRRSQTGTVRSGDYRFRSCLKSRPVIITSILST